MRVPWYLMAKGKGGGGYKTASGPIVSVSDALAAPLRSLLVNIDPVQDLHGYDSPWPAGSAYNKLPCPTAFTETSNGITLASDGIGQYTLKGTATAAFEHKFNIPETVLPDTVYIHLLNSAGGSSNGSININFYNGNTRVDYIGFSTMANRKYNGTTTLGGKTINAISIRVANAEAISGTLTFSPMALTANDTVAFIPYSNICPISGWDEANVWRTGKNLLDVDKYGQTLPRTQNGITWSKVSDGVYHASGTATGNSYFNLSFYADLQSAMPCISFRGQRITLSSTDVHIKPAIAYFAKDGSFTQLSNGGIIPDNAVGLRAYVRIDKDTAIDTDFSVQLELGSTATAYEPYQGNTYTIQLGQTVYGATLDVTNGVLTVDRAMFTPTIGTNAITDMSTATDRITRVSYTLSDYNLPDAPTANVTEQSLGRYSHGVYNGTNSGWSSKSYHGYAASLRAHIFVDCDPTSADVTAYLAAQVTAGTPVQLVYPLATPITIPLTPTEISTLQGQNNVWADTGDVTVEYLSAGGADPDLMKLAVAFMGRK